MTVKQQAHDVVARLPNDCSWIDVERELMLAHIRERIAESQRPDVSWIDHEQIKQRMRQWLSE